MNGKRHRRIVTGSASEKSKDNDNTGTTKTLQDEPVIGHNSVFLRGHSRPALRTSSCNVESNIRDDETNGTGMFRNINQKVSDEDRSTPESGRDTDELETDGDTDGGGDAFDNFADISTSGLNNLKTNNSTFNNTSNASALAYFNAFQGQPLRAIQSVDSAQLKFSVARPPAIVAVSSLPMPDTSSNNNNNNNNNTDSTDSENSNCSDATVTSGKQQVMHAPAASRPHPSRPQRLSIATPTRRPSPLQIGSADPFKHQHHRNSSSNGSLNLADRVVEDGYNANDETEDSDFFPTNSPYVSDISPSSLKPPSFLRVTSFSAFSSAPLYDENSERRVAKLRKERRRREAGTEEFNRLRTMFTKNAVATLISKAVKAKRVIDVPTK